MAFEERKEQALKSSADAAPKTPEAVRWSFLKKAAFEQAPLGYFTEANMSVKKLQACWPAMANKTTVINNTVFAFDKNGVCTVLDEGNTRLDYELLLQKRHVQPWPLQPVPAAVPASVEEPQAAAPVVDSAPEEMVIEAEPEADAPPVLAPDDNEAGKLRRRPASRAK